MRKDFPDAIFWVADLVTDARARRTVKVAYPDSLTTWRVTARAVTQDTRLGRPRPRTTTTKDVIVRVATPRFLTEGDTVSVPVVAHNYLPEPKAFEREADGHGRHGGAGHADGPAAGGDPVAGPAPQQLDVPAPHGGPGGLHRHKPQPAPTATPRNRPFRCFPTASCARSAVSGTPGGDGRAHR